MLWQADPTIEIFGVEVPDPRSLPEHATLKVLYLTVVSLDPTGKGRARWSNRSKPH